MATYTPNLNLGKPEATDPFGNFRQLFNDNMDILDNGGGGGSGGHTIIDENGNSLPQESGLQFTGGVTVTDDSVNGKTVVDISGGGGNVYGAFIDPTRSLTSSIAFSNGTPINYTATEDCIVEIYNDSANALEYCVDGLAVYLLASGSYTMPLPLKKGQTLTSVSANSYSGAYHVYGLTQGTSGIFTPIIYSDTERVVGVWRDNKPLYQKTISVAPLPNSGTKEIQLDNDIEKIISMNGYAIDGNDKWDIFFNDVVPTNNNASIRVYTNTTTKKLYITTAVDLRSYTEAYITLQYTKTTDVAGSGNWNTDGVPTVHYSTSEQVIGTWLGKPLYQRTWDFISTNIINANTWTNLFSNDIDIDKITMNETLDDEGRSNKVAYCGVRNGYVAVYSTYTTNIQTITLRYTKSTD